MNALLFYEQKRLEKIAINSFYFSLALAIFSGQGLFLNNSLYAYEVNIAQAPYLGGNIQIEQLPAKVETESDLLAQRHKWEASMRRKYNTGTVSVVEPGVVHVKLTKYINSQPIKINIVEVNKKINPNIEFSPALASQSLAHKASVRTIAQKNNSIVAVNGTFFKPQTGVPLGALMIDKKIITSPIYNRVAMGIGKDEFKMSRLELDAKLTSLTSSMTIDNINQPRMLMSHTIAYTKDWGQKSPPTPKYGIQIAVENNKITKISDGSIEIPQDGYVISGPKKELEPFFNAISVQVDIKTSPNWENIDHIISGGPYLVKESQLFVDTAAQKLNAISGKNPRTAIGYTKDNDLILVTIDGRETSSVGMNIYELAKLMRTIGCYNAMNLDGGGSSIMYIKGKIVNNPSIQGGIALSNAFTVSVNTPPTQISYDDKNKDKEK